MYGSFGELDVERQRRIEVGERLEDERDAVIALGGKRAEFGFGHGAWTISSIGAAGQSAETALGHRLAARDARCDGRQRQRRLVDARRQQAAMDGAAGGIGCGGRSARGAESSILVMRGRRSGRRSASVVHRLDYTIGLEVVHRPALAIAVGTTSTGQPAPRAASTSLPESPTISSRPVGMPKHRCDVPQRAGSGFCVGRSSPPITTEK